MAQQQWGGSPPYGQPPYRQPGYPPPAPGASPYGGNPNSWGSYGQPQFGRPAFGGPHLGPPQYGPPRVPGPRRRGPLRLLLVALIGISLLALAGLMLSGMTSEQSAVAYQNDDYQVPPPDRSPPPLPVPQTYDEATALIARNPVYDQMAPLPVRCNSQPINVRTASDDQLKEHFEGLMECLVRFWQPPVTSAGFIIVRPTRHDLRQGDDHEVRQERSERLLLFRRPTGLLLRNQLPDAVPIVRRDKWAADVVMAHEFGHAFQARTGILISSLALGANANDKSVQLQFSRRLETQADCFSGCSSGASRSRSAFSSGPGRYPADLRRGRRRHADRRAKASSATTDVPRAGSTGATPVCRHQRGGQVQHLCRASAGLVR